MSFGHIKIRPSDKLFREYLLKLKGEICECCGRKGRVEMSHFFGRRSENTRFSEVNVDVLCSGCHRKFHERPSEYNNWKLKKLGQKEFNKLTLEANRYKKRDDVMDLLVIKELLKKLTTRPATYKG